MEKVQQRKIVQLFGIPINALTMSEVIQLIDHSINNRILLKIGVVNAAKVVNMQKDIQLRNAVLSSDVILPDGMSIVWASRFFGSPLPERVTGIDLMFEILKLCDQKQYRVYLLGATDDIVKTVVTRIKNDFPMVEITGFRNGYFKETDERSIAEEIKNSKSDVLFIGITSPKKEIFLSRWARYMEVPVCHGVGGSFDVIAGKVKRAPEFIQKIGLEWLFRVYQEPRRLWKRYVVTNSIFLWMMFVELLKTRIGYSRLS